MELKEPLTLAITGMATVFLILGFLVLTGKALIGIVNRYFPGADPDKGPGQDSQYQKKIAAITAAVEIITSGKGKITDIKKI